MTLNDLFEEKWHLINQISAMEQFVTNNYNIFASKITKKQVMIT